MFYTSKKEEVKEKPKTVYDKFAEAFSDKENLNIFRDVFRILSEEVEFLTAKDIKKSDKVKDLKKILGDKLYKDLVKELTLGYTLDDWEKNDFKNPAKVASDFDQFHNQFISAEKGEEFFNQYIEADNLIRKILGEKENGIKVKENKSIFYKNKIRVIAYEKVHMVAQKIYQAFPKEKLDKSIGIR